MSKFHLSDDGVTRPCKAQTPESCTATPPDGMSKDDSHFSNMKDGLVAYENYMTQTYSEFGDHEKKEDFVVPEVKSYDREFREVSGREYREKFVEDFVNTRMSNFGLSKEDDPEVYDHLKGQYSDYESGYSIESYDLQEASTKIEKKMPYLDKKVSLKQESANNAAYIKRMFKQPDVVPVLEGDPTMMVVGEDGNESADLGTFGKGGFPKMPKGFYNDSVRGLKDGEVVIAVPSRSFDREATLKEITKMPGYLGHTGSTRDGYDSHGLALFKVPSELQGEAKEEIRKSKNSVDSTKERREKFFDNYEKIKSDFEKAEKSDANGRVPWDTGSPASYTNYSAVKDSVGERAIRKNEETLSSAKKDILSNKKKREETIRQIDKALGGDTTPWKGYPRSNGTMALRNDEDSKSSAFSHIMPSTMTENVKRYKSAVASNDTARQEALRKTLERDRKILQDAENFQKAESHMNKVNKELRDRAETDLDTYVREDAPKNASEKSIEKVKKVVKERLKNGA